MNLRENDTHGDSNTKRNDTYLRTVFTQVRAEEEACVPSFAGMWNAAEKRVRATQNIRVRRGWYARFEFAAVLSALVCILAISFLLVYRNDYRLSNREAVSGAEYLLEWESPTTALLLISYQEAWEDDDTTPSSSSEAGSSLSTWEMPTDSLLPSFSDDENIDPETS